MPNGSSFILLLEILARLLNEISSTQGIVWYITVLWVMGDQTNKI